MERQNIENTGYRITKYLTENIEVAKYRTQIIETARNRNNFIEHAKKVMSAYVKLEWVRLG